MLTVFVSSKIMTFKSQAHNTEFDFDTCKSKAFHE